MVRFTMIPVDHLINLPDPSWLIEGLIEEHVLGVLYGASGEGKSFVALDWALSVANDQRWCGRAVRPGPVIYVAAEGGRNIGKRIGAWKTANGIDRIEDALVVMEAVQFFVPDHVEGSSTRLMDAVDLQS
jgi:putative DNA primase/helicase